jgi:hypothetical protein
MNDMNPTIRFKLEDRVDEGVQDILSHNRIDLVDVPHVPDGLPIFILSGRELLAINEAMGEFGRGGDWSSGYHESKNIILAMDDRFSRLLIHHLSLIGSHFATSMAVMGLEDRVIVSLQRYFERMGCRYITRGDRGVERAFSREWSEGEDRILKATIKAGVPIGIIADTLGRTIKAVNDRKRRTLDSNNSQYWDTEQDDVLDDSLLDPSRPDLFVISKKIPGKKNVAMIVRRLQERFGTPKVETARKILEEQS